MPRGGTVSRRSPSITHAHPSHLVINLSDIVARPSGRFMLRHPAHLVALGFGAGLVPLAPGTAGTLVALPVYWLIAGLDPLGYLAVLVIEGKVKFFALMNHPCVPMMFLFLFWILDCEELLAILIVPCSNSPFATLGCL